MKGVLRGIGIGFAALIVIVSLFSGYWVVRYHLVVSKEPGKLAGTVSPVDDRLALVDPFIGTGGFPAWVCAYNFPGATAPFGVVRLGPETISMLTDNRALNTSGYYYGDDRMLGFSHTRLIGTGAVDGGHFLVLPLLGHAGQRSADTPTARFSHKDEKAFPGYYAVRTKDSNVLCELTASKRAGVHRYTYPAEAVPRLRIDVGNANGGRRSEDCSIHIDPGNNSLEGHVRTFGSFAGRYGGIKVYFFATFTGSLDDYSTWDDGGYQHQRAEASGNDAGVELVFSTKEGPQMIELRLAISHVSIENARDNLLAEAYDRSFEEILETTQRAWAQKLGLIDIEGASAQQKQIFYSALYRCFQMPTDFTDVDSTYMGFDKKVHRAQGFTYYTDMSLWDTFRTLHPLYNLIAREEQQDMMASLVEMGKHGGYLPRWPSGYGYTNSMLGTPADIAITEAWLKDIRGFDPELAFEMMTKTSLKPTPDDAAFSGRRGNAECLACGYCPADRMRQAVSRTLEYAWSDHSIGLFAGSLGKWDEARFFRDKSLAYREVWNPESMYFHPRNADGTFVEKFKPLLLTYLDFDNEYTDDYVEGNALQWRWMVPQDPAGLIELFGGEEVFVQELNAFFEQSNPDMATWTPGNYYWHGNEPDIHAAYLFNAAGRPDLTQKWVRWIVDNKYGTGYVGLDGNDDGATLSAWYVLSVLGFYPIAGTDIYQIGTPLFAGAAVHMGEQVLEIKASPDPGENMYVQKVSLNGELLDRHWFRHEEIAEGGELVFEMGPFPAGESR